MSCWNLLSATLVITGAIIMSSGIYGGALAEPFLPVTGKAGCHRPSSAFKVSQTRTDNNTDGTSIKASSFRNSSAVWAQLFVEAREVINSMYENVPQSSSQNSAIIKADTFLLVYTREIPETVRGFDQCLSFPDVTTKIVVRELALPCSQREVLHVLVSALDMGATLRGVVIASTEMEFIRLVLNTVSTQAVFRWTRFLHATEWILLTVQPLTSTADFSIDQHDFPDFLTALFLAKKDGEVFLDILQKSRLNTTQTSLPLKSSSLEKDIGTPRGSNHQRPRPLLNASYLAEHFRETADLYLSTKQSILADMRIPAVFVVSEADKTAYPVTEGNITTWKGFNVDVLQVLSQALGFTILPFAVTDGGFYGHVKPDGKSVGALGYLHRREAGLCSMALTRNAQRLEYVDFVHPSIRENHFYIIYKVDHKSWQLGDILSELVKTRTGLIFLLAGPCVAFPAGLLVFLVNRALFNRRRLFGRKNLKQLYDFPFHWFFQTVEPHHHQSGRILRAGWGLFCVAIFASYGAILTSNATAPIEYPEISGLEDLLALPEFSIGISPASSHHISTFKRAKPGTAYSRLWQALLWMNKSDPRTFSPDKGYHIKKMLKGGYAFLGAMPKGLLSSLVDADFSDVRFAILSTDNNYMAVPQRTFYKSEIERALLAATEAGIVKILLDKWIPPEASMEVSDSEDNTVIHLERLRVLVLTAVSGIGLACLCLIIEHVLHRRRRLHQEIT